MTSRSANAPAVVRRLARGCTAISPRSRTRLLAVFLAINLVVVLLSATDAYRLGWLESALWIRQLDFDVEGTLANSYAAIIWAAVAVLTLAQLTRPPPSNRRRWLWVLGWLSVALLATLVALEEGFSLKDRLVGRMAWFDLAGLKAAELPPNARWLVAAVPLFAAPLAAAGWVFHTSQRRHPTLRLLTLLAVVLLVEAVAQDAFNVLDIPILAWEHFVEEGAETMAAAALAVILVEMLAARPGALPIAPVSRRVRMAALAVTVGLLAVSAFPLVSHRVHKGDGWETVAPWSYTGPITLVEQQFRANQDNLRRIDVWAYADGGAAGEAAEIFARLTPEGSDRPIRESRAGVHGTRFSNATVAFDFAPIPDSSGKVYTLAVGVLSGPTPYVFLGLTGGDAIPEGTAKVSGSPTRHADDLAMRTGWSGRFIDGLYPRDQRHWGLIGEVILNIFLWVLLVVITWAGLSGRRPRFWRRFVLPSVLASALITTVITSVTLAFLAVLSPTQLP